MNGKDDSAREVLKFQEALRRQIEPLEAIRRQITPLSAMIDAVRPTNNFLGIQESIRAAIGPLEELRRIGAFQFPAVRELEEMQRHLAEFKAQFRLPEVQELQTLARQFEALPTSIVRIQRDWTELRDAMAAMRQPWLDAKNLAQSFGSFAELQSIGSALHTLPPFDEGLAERLRIDLGDWRVPLNFVTEDLVDPFARTEFYIARGLDPALSAFPAAAFQESTTVAGLRAASPPVAAAYSREAEEAASDDEEDFSRTNAAYDRLLRFETQLRRFIDERMAAAFGPRWIKQRVPGSIWQAWEEKRQRARDAGEREWPLIAYADFTDYVTIIIRKDNWDAVFAPIFRRQSLVQESFQRLFPIRICTMHARPITQDDELYLLVETKRLLDSMAPG